MSFRISCRNSAINNFLSGFRLQQFLKVILPELRLYARSLFYLAYLYVQPHLPTVLAFRDLFDEIEFGSADWRRIKAVIKSCCDGPNSGNYPGGVPYPEDEITFAIRHHLSNLERIVDSGINKTRF